jgi:hypothetical protein
LHERVTINTIAAVGFGKTFVDSAAELLKSAGV